MFLQDVVVDLLASAAPTRGDKSRLAQSAAMQPAALSRILARGAMPMIRTAERLARVLPSSASEQHYWLSLVHEYWKCRRTAGKPSAGLPLRYNHDEFLALRKRQATVQHSAAAFTGQSSSYRTLYDDALAMIQSMSPRSTATVSSYAYLCSVLHDTAQELGNRSEALLWARRGRLVSEQIELPHKNEEARHLMLLNQVNSLRSEAAALHELDLYKASHDRCEQARQTEGFRADPGYWSLQVARDQLKALAHIPRTRLWMVEGNIISARRQSADITHPAAELLDMLLSCAGAQAYLTLRKPRTALAELRPWRDRVHAIPLIGPVHLVQFHKMWGEVQNTLGNFSEGAHALDQARSIARTAGLWSALAKLEPKEGIGDRG
jgi:hypothetical protein